MSGALAINPMPMTVGQLLAMYQGLQRDRYDHTTAIISVWSKKPVKNPYRHREFKAMRRAELYAVQRAIEERNARRNGQERIRR